MVSKTWFWAGGAISAAARGICMLEWVKYLPGLSAFRLVAHAYFSGYLRDLSVLRNVDMLMIMLINWHTELVHMLLFK